MSYQEVKFSQKSHWQQQRDSEFPNPDDLESICLIRKCRDLEKFFNSNLILQPDADTCLHPREIKEDLQSRDHDLRLAKHVGRVDMSIVVEVERAVGWPWLWDLA